MKPGAGRQQGSPDREVLAGPVERVTFHNPENGFCVLRTRARGHCELVTVVGHAATVAPGEWITASGEWVNDRTHGQQFKARFIRTAAPSSVEGIEKYLGSGMIRGIGPVYARKLMRAFGEKVFDVIEAEPERLREVTGIGRVRAKRITDAWAEQKVVREIMVFLHEHAVGTARAVRIFRTYGADAVEVMTENPYRLARDIRGIGFVTADAIAMRLGIEKTAMVRVRAGVGHALAEAMDEGHCGLPEEELGPLAAKLLEVPAELIRTALDLELAEGAVVSDTVEDTPCIFLGGLHRAERAIAGCILDIAAGEPSWPRIDPDKALPWVERRTGLALAPGQAEAVRTALASKVSVITGGPGVGKTTIVNAILRILSAKGVDILLCAPTGRAAKRMSEATGFEAKTIHRLLEVDPRTGGFKRYRENPLDCGLLVVDETSMVDVLLMRSLLAAVPDEVALLIVGDVDQLPSVGPGQVLADIIASGAVPVVRLTEVFRQAARSRIVTVAHGINRGAIPDLSRPEGESDFYFVAAEDPETAVARIVELVKARIPRRFGLDSGTRHPGAVPDEPGRRRRPLAQHRAPGVPQPGRRAQGRALRLDLRDGRQGDADRERLRQGGLQRRHRRGRGHMDPEAGELTARFEGRDLLYGFGELDALVPAYAATVHKSQGSEYPAVVIPVLTQHYAMLKRNLLYTGDHAGQAAGGAGGPEEGCGHRGAQRLGTPALVEAGRMAGRRDGWWGNRNRPRCVGAPRAAVDRRHTLRVIGERDTTR